jgi:NTP pyrophosphatase (non-canonical NTP hydrolase)
MTKKIDLKKYRKFVDAVTSDESKDFIAFSDRVVSLDEKGANIERLLTGAVGINSEGGELLEVVKKLLFQGKEFNQETKTHLLKELGDTLFYIMEVCISLDTTIEEVMNINFQKLSSRYPEGKFDIYYSQHREDGDI